ncbi:peptidase [Salmonella enterica]|uniref:Peptidase n=1 Tax=Salmonella enterica TaxID=28901 RepID=A0A5T2MDN7_SALER|nr:peptidase [Salmonella enterica]EDR2617157.1 peptidase [Salmonella enterica subsp. enterica]EDV4868555.1 peptidase [Salmonella enterica subsp. enterica]
MTLPALAINATIPKVSIHNGKAVTTTQDVADYFRKLHKDVLKKVSTLECSPEFNERNFAPVEYIDAKGEKRPMYEMTKDGFVFLVMGFTGKKAAAFKEAYIAEFNRMEAELYSGALKAAQNVSQEEIDAYNINALLIHLNVMYEVWSTQIEPALRKIESPLAGKLHDHFKDGVIFARYVEQSLNGKLLPHQKPRTH